MLFIGNRESWRKGSLVRKFDREVLESRSISCISKFWKSVR